MLRLYRRIATMDATAPLPSLPDQAPTWALASRLASTWGLNQLADRLAKRHDVVVRECRESPGFLPSDERSQWQDCAKTGHSPTARRTG